MAAIDHRDQDPPSRAPTANGPGALEGSNRLMPHPGHATGGNSAADAGPDPIGFGCAFLHGGGARRRSAALVEAAFDAGIRYFDVARLYGEGEAEGVVGEVLADVRDQVVLVSKAGILPTDRSLPRRVVEHGVRALRRLPGAASAIPPLRPAEPTFHVFDARRVRRSVETSLKRLRTTRLDILLLHECGADDLARHDVLGTLSALRTEGKLASFGLATSLADTLAIIRTTPMDVVQIASSPLRPDVTELPMMNVGSVVTHSAMRDVLPIVARVCADPDLRAEWTRTLAFDPRDREALFAMVSAHAARLNPGGRMLFSSSSPDTIRRNVAACRSIPFDEKDVIRFGSHLRELGRR